MNKLRKQIFIHWFFLITGILVWSAGCALKPRYLAESYAPPQRMALLPVSNQTNDLDGPDMVRQLMFEHISLRGYNPLSLDQTDALLKEMGISEGGHLRAFKPQDIGEKLSVDGLMYGELIEFGLLNVGFYKNKKVQACFKLVDAKTGDVLWEDERTVSKKELTLDKDEARKAFFEGLAEKAVMKMFSVHLQPEAQECVARILSTLPPNR